MGDAMSKTEGTDNLTVSCMHRLQRWRMAFFGVVILLAGLVIGGASMLIFMPHRLMRPPRGPEFETMRMIGPLRRDLGLSGEQTERIKPILDKHMGKLSDIREDARSEISKTLEKMNQEISAILTEGQRQIWQGQLVRLQQANGNFTRYDQILFQRLQCLRNRRKAHGFLIPALYQQVSSVDLCADILYGFVAGAKEENPSHHGTIFPINIFNRCRRDEAVFFAAAKHGKHIGHDYHTVAA